MDNQENWPPVLPPEIIHHIFKYLSVTEIIRCRQVSLLWKQIADREDIWRELCKRELSDAFDEATLKCRPHLSWRSLFKSISLWPKLTTAKETWHEFAANNDIKYEIRTVNVRHGVVAVHRANSIEYYNLESFELIDSFNGDYIKYEENDDVLALLHNLPENGVERDDCLKIIRKVNNRHIFDSVVIIENVTNFKIVDKNVYYLKESEIDSEIYVCKRDSNYRSSFKHTIPKLVWAFSDNDNKFGVLTNHYELHEFVDSKFVCTRNYNLHLNADYLKLHKYNFFEDIDFFKHDTLLRCLAYTAHPPVADVFTSIFYSTTIRFIYSNMLFIGDNCGVLKVYLLRSYSVDIGHPEKVYLISSNGSNADRSINGIEVVETEKGHVIVISTSQKVVCVNLEHDKFCT